MTSMTMKGGTRPRPATFSAMAAAPLPPASPLPLASPWVLPWTPLLHHDAEAVAALVGGDLATRGVDAQAGRAAQGVDPPDAALRRSEEHTSELPSLMRHSHDVFCL